jgi:hypothetical protein
MGTGTNFNGLGSYGEEVAHTPVHAENYPTSPKRSFFRALLAPEPVFRTADLCAFPVFSAKIYIPDGYPDFQRKMWLVIGPITTLLYDAPWPYGERINADVPCLWDSASPFSG